LSVYVTIYTYKGKINPDTQYPNPLSTPNFLLNFKEDAVIDLAASFVGLIIMNSKCVNNNLM